MVVYNIKKKDIDIDIIILKYALKVRKFSYTDIDKKYGDNARIKIATTKTIMDRHVKEKLVPKRYILMVENDPDKKPYHINPYIKTLDKDLDKQIKKGGEKKENHDILLEISLFKETELRNRITRPEITPIGKDFGDLTNEVFISNEANWFLANIFYSFLREEIIFNPGLWEKLIKPAHFNFRFEIKCNWEKDPKIFILINELKEMYKKIGYIPHNVNSPFHRKEVTKLNNKNDEEYYMTAVYQETVRQLTEKKVEDMSKFFQNRYVNLVSGFKQLSKVIEGNELELKGLGPIFNHLLSIDKLKNLTIEERKEVSEVYLNSLEQLKNKIFSFLGIED